MNEYNRVREEIAQKINLMPKDGYTYGCDVADSILSIKGLAVLSENQKLPDNPYSDDTEEYGYKNGYTLAQQDMKDFRRIVK